jgi:hypothetical protein
MLMADSAITMLSPMRSTLGFTYSNVSGYSGACQ